ncbi:MAG: hypothetical protein ACRD3W_06915 [Terriglobales bacterium]
MELKFPNARLFIHDLLSRGGLRDSAAIVRGAAEYGLISADCLAEFQEETDPHLCQCIATGRQVVAKCFEQKAKQGLPAVDSEEIWIEIERNVQRYRKALERGGAVSGAAAPETSNCLKLAPALFDLILQQINRYP